MKTIFGIVGLAAIVGAVSTLGGSTNIMQQGVGATIGVIGAILLAAYGIIGAIENIPLNKAKFDRKLAAAAAARQQKMAAQNVAR